MEPVSLVDLANRLRIARNAGLSQEGAATKTGIPQPSISAMESGKRNVDTLELVKFAELYRRPVDFFLSPNFRDERKSFAPVLVAKDILDSERAVLDDFRMFCQDYADLEGSYSAK